MIVVETVVLEEDELASVQIKTTEIEFSTDSSTTPVPFTSIVPQHGTRKFDADKVARIKAQIESGEYEINPSRIVSRIIDLRT